MSAVTDKAARYVAEGRVTIRHRAGDLVTASVRGSSTYSVAFDVDALRWRCTCPATRTCSHIIAVETVVAPTSTGPEISGGDAS